MQADRPIARNLATALPSLQGNQRSASIHRDPYDLGPAVNPEVIHAAWYGQIVYDVKYVLSLG